MPRDLNGWRMHSAVALPLYPAQGQLVPNTVSYVLSSGDGFSLQLSFTNHSLIFLVRQVIFPESLPAVTHC